MHQAKHHSTISNACPCLQGQHTVQVLPAQHLIQLPANFPEKTMKDDSSPIWRTQKMLLSSHGHSSSHCGKGTSRWMTFLSLSKLTFQ